VVSLNVQNVKAGVPHDVIFTVFSLWPPCGLGVDSACNRNECQGYLWRVKVTGA